MEKAEIASSYIDQCKVKYATEDVCTYDALVVGVAPGNIGAAISRELSLEGWFATDYAKGELSEDVIDRNSSALILSNGTNNMNWAENMTEEQTTEVIFDTLLTSMNLAQAFVRRTLGTPQRKKIVFIGSMAYRNVLNASSAYCAAKAGLAHYSRCLAWELAPKGYDFFCVHPSNTLDTPMAEATIKGIMEYRGVDRKTAEGYWGAILPRDKFLTKKEIAQTVVGLLSPKSVYLSGGQIELGGGQR